MPSSEDARLARRKQASVVVMVPSMTSEWPTMYLVAAWIETSTPWANGANSSPALQVLSSMTTAPAARAAAARRGMS